MTNTANVLLTAAQAAMHSPRLDEREHAAKYEAGIKRLIAEVEGIENLPPVKPRRRSQPPQLSTVNSSQL